MSEPANFNRAAESYPPLRTAIAGLLGLMIACFFSFLDRQILNLLVQPIKHDLQISDTQIGVLQGIAFALSYSVMALPFGWLADNYNRVRLICLGLVTWSLATLAMGFSDSFTAMLASRILIGAAEAALMPAAYSLLSDYFPPHQRGRVFAVYMSAVSLGGGGALIAGGFLLGLLHHVDMVWLPLIGALPVWRAAFVIVSIPGLALALPLILVLREPLRQGYAAAKSKYGGGMMAYLSKNRWAFFTVFSAYSLFALVGYAVQSWAPTLLIRNYGVPPSAAGILIGLSTLLPALIVVPITGIVGDRWVTQGRRGGRLALLYPFWILNVPALLLFALSGDLRLAVLGFVIQSLVGGVAFMSSSAAVQDMVPSHLRGRVIASWYLITGIIGNGFGPVITGVVNDHVFRSEDALPYSILTIAVPCLLLGLVLTRMGITAYDRTCRHGGGSGSRAN